MTWSAPSPKGFGRSLPDSLLDFFPFSLSPTTFLFYIPSALHTLLQDFFRMLAARSLKP